LLVGNVPRPSQKVQIILCPGASLPQQPCRNLFSPLFSPPLSSLIFPLFLSLFSPYPFPLPPFPSFSPHLPFPPLPPMPRSSLLNQVRGSGGATSAPRRGPGGAPVSEGERAYGLLSILALEVRDEGQLCTLLFNL